MTQTLQKKKEEIINFLNKDYIIHAQVLLDRLVEELGYNKKDYYRTYKYDINNRKRI